VFVAVVMQHAMRMRHILICGVRHIVICGPVRLYYIFSTLSHK